MLDVGPEGLARDSSFAKSAQCLVKAEDTPEVAENERLVTETSLSRSAGSEYHGADFTSTPAAECTVSSDAALCSQKSLSPLHLSSLKTETSPAEEISESTDGSGNAPHPQALKGEGTDSTDAHCATGTKSEELTVGDPREASENQPVAQSSITTNAVEEIPSAPVDACVELHPLVKAEVVCDVADDDIKRLQDESSPEIGDTSLKNEGQTTSTEDKLPPNDNSEDMEVDSVDGLDAHVENLKEQESERAESDRECKRRMLMSERRVKLRHVDPWLAETDGISTVKKRDGILPDEDDSLFEIPSFLEPLYSVSQSNFRSGDISPTALVDEIEEILKSHTADVPLVSGSPEEDPVVGSPLIKRQSARSPLRPFTVLDRIMSKLKRRPIILVPNEEAMLSGVGWQQSVLHFGNTWEFLEKGRLVLPGQKSVDDDRPVIQQGRQIVSQKFSFRSHPVKFALVDCAKICRFDSVDWESVICVLLSGQEWQLKDWPLSQDEIFTKLKCFFFTFKDAPLPKVVVSSKCQVFSFPRMLRHIDGEIQRAFWSALGDHVSRPLEDEK
eukprot:Gregarina_sp_Poly_1__1390@NODE_1345_length_4331_cov_47_703565_g903_i0_p1_GENE_NODE_1345_length_4331_cov_47_703565_g903_i0NODE_1345_length_4331_cov_47_703565_g903_i0_p1_ORF_typecomplete_len558_score94_50CDC73_C/PF05179_14/6_1e24_NODE_1345_length_4331_cov_47_703565_g903_i025954268